MSIDPGSTPWALAFAKSGKERDVSTLTLQSWVGITQIWHLYCWMCWCTSVALGVHISVCCRSITMDRFKPEEVLRMEKGGNDKWQSFGGTQWDLSLPIRAKFDNYVAGKTIKNTCCVCIEDGTSYQKDHSANGLCQLARTILSPTNGNCTNHLTKQKRRLLCSSWIRKRTKIGSLPPSQGGKYSGFGTQRHLLHPVDQVVRFCPFLSIVSKKIPLVLSYEGMGIVFLNCGQIREWSEWNSDKTGFSHLQETDIGLKG